MITHHIHEVLRHLPPGSVIPGDDTERVKNALGRLIGRRPADRLLGRAGVVGAAHMKADELAAVAELPARLAERVVAARDLGLAITAPPSATLRSSADVVRVLPLGIETLETEVLLGFALTANLAVKSTVLLAKGGGSRASVNLRDVLVPFVRLGAAAFVLAHNHPGKTMAPTTDDIELTRRVMAAGRIVGIELLDHVIVTVKGAVSLRDLGAIPDVADAAA